MRSVGSPRYLINDSYSYGCIRLIYRIRCLGWTYPGQTDVCHLKLPLNSIDFIYLACGMAFTYPHQNL
ncbi:hypothetical protein PILCRDRAFT_714978 [Piloderma croceum F 1598]|uniref:Uncharacterized protein n=1 Tax=Piloderma croceum (strain F 1598) TaxID=765440 RepID=A0A0C3AJL6_PILCF|nr:hypothetical protein PILCRDRAFT_714978 [Piloderma croceum F 1598]